GLNSPLTDPVAFVHDLFTFPIDDQPAPYQEEILAKLTEERYISVRSPHGAGKTALASWAVLWFACTHPDNTKIPTTASAWRQLKEYLWPEIHLWYNRADWGKWRRMGGYVPEMFSLKMEVGHSCRAFALASDDEAKIEGAHGAAVLYVFDESKAIPNKTWDAAAGAFATGDARWLSISTPGDRSGRFYDIQRKAPGLDHWWVRHIKIDEAIDAGRISGDWVKTMKKEWGEDSPVFQARVL
ncbi:unnamed protein product, partial [marine sediment metagenome]